MIFMIFTFYYNYFIIIILLTLFFALILDLIIGDFKSKYHPVNIIGLTINWLKMKIKTGKPKLDKILGIILLLLVILIFCVPILFLQIIIWEVWNIFAPKNVLIIDILMIFILSILMGFLLKWSLAVKSLGDATLPIQKALSNNNLNQARSHLSFIVRRDCENLNRSYIISATVECIAESITDAITSVIWFYLMGNLFGILIYNFISNYHLWLFLGIPFAYVFRIINTADSIVGYKDQEHKNIGWFSARMDDISNFIPTRLTTLFMFLAGKIMKKNTNNAWNILKSDRTNTESINAGWTMGTMAGLLNVQLEKIGNYKLGIPNRSLVPNDIKIAYRIFQITVFFFTIIISFIISFFIFLLCLI